MNRNIFDTEIGVEKFGMGTPYSHAGKLPEDLLVGYVLFFVFVFLHSYLLGMLCNFHKIPKSSTKNK